MKWTIYDIHYKKVRSVIMLTLQIYVLNSFFDFLCIDGLYLGLLFSFVPCPCVERVFDIRLCECVNFILT